MKLYKFLALCILMTLFPNLSYASCEVQEVIEMVEEKMSKKMIIEECDNEIDVEFCSLNKVRLLIKKGKSEQAIYDQCDSEQTNLNSQSTGLPSGSLLRPCGCWGYVTIGETRHDGRCQSQYSQAQACQAFCPTGGYQWGVRCQ